jgi:hypothetical protein
MSWASTTPDLNDLPTGRVRLRTTASVFRKTPTADALHFVYNWDMGSEDTTTVRVRRPDSERLQSLAKRRKTSVIEVVHAAIVALERQEFLDGLSDDYRRLRQDAPKWQAFLAEREEWDSVG